MHRSRPPAPPGLPARGSPALARVARRKDRVATRTENASDRRANAGVVFDHQNPFGPPSAGRGLRGTRRRDRLVDPRQINVEAGPLPDLARDLDVPVALLDDP